MKTSKAKAIEAFEKLQEIVLITFNLNGYEKELETIHQELKKPTLDDAIKVVEEKLNKEYTQIDTATGQVERSYYRSRSGALYEILTALKRLKGE